MGTKYAINTVSRLFTTVEITGMVDSLEKTGLFDIVREEDDRITITHTRFNRVVFKALKRGSADAWITRLAANLFTVKG